MKGKKDVIRSVRYDKELYAKLSELAEADNRSVTNYIETVLKAHVEGKKK